jgi:hypothetical protein
MTLPDLPDLPDAPGQDATYDERMRHFEATMRLAEYEQRERLDSAAALRDQAADARTTVLAQSHQALAAAQAEATIVAGRQAAALDRQAAAAERMAELMEETPPGSPSATDGTSDRARVVVTAMMAETDKPPAEVVSAVQARIGAADSLLEQ